MAGSDDIDLVKCRHYARFAAHLDRLHFDAIYWVLFVVVIFMLFAASWRYGKSIDDVEGLERGSAAHRRKMKRCMLVCSVYALVSVVAIVMEVFALMALQFCDGEDLMSLYWSTWTVMQIGSLIAIFGVLLAVFHAIRGRKHPPWALALGTPVLVVAGLGHIIQGALHKKVRSVRRRSSVRGNRYLPGMSTTDTITAEDLEDHDTEMEYTYTAKVLGFTPDGATILQLLDDPSLPAPPVGPLLSPTAQARIISTDTDGKVVISLRDSGGKSGASPVKAQDEEKRHPVPIIATPVRARSSTPATVTVQLPSPAAKRTGPVTKTGKDALPGSALPPVETMGPCATASASLKGGTPATSPTAAGDARSDSPASADGRGDVSSVPRGAMSV